MGSERTYEDLVLSALTEGLRTISAEWAFQAAQARRAVARQVRDAIADFPYELSVDERLPVHWVESRRPVRLFPLGKYRYTWIEDTTGRTTVYLGDDGRLYEYGPANIRPDYEENDIVVEDNLMRLREIEVDELQFHELLICRNLLQQVVMA